MSAGVHEDESTGEPTQPCQCHSIRLGPNAKPNEMAVFYSLPLFMPACNRGVGDTHYDGRISKESPLRSIYHIFQSLRN